VKFEPKQALQSAGMRVGWVIQSYELSEMRQHLMSILSAR